MLWGISFKDGYRYGFQGQEMDNEAQGVGNSYSFTYRGYDSRLGRFISVDPLTKQYPYYTPYQFAGNKAINSVDVDGLEDAKFDGQERNDWKAAKQLYPSNLDKQFDYVHGNQQARGIGASIGLLSIGAIYTSPEWTPYVARGYRLYQGYKPLVGAVNNIGANYLATRITGGSYSFKNFVLDGTEGAILGTCSPELTSKNLFTGGLTTFGLNFEFSLLKYWTDKSTENVKWEDPIGLSYNTIKRNFFNMSMSNSIKTGIIGGAAGAAGAFGQFGVEKAFLKMPATNYSAMYPAWKAFIFRELDGLSETTETVAAPKEEEKK